MLVVAIAFFVALPQAAPPGSIGCCTSGSRCRARRFQAMTGALKLTIVDRLPRRHPPHPRDSPRFPVPRRRAQDDQHLRGGRGARPSRTRARKTTLAPALRDDVPRHGGPRLDPRLHRRRARCCRASTPGAPSLDNVVFFLEKLPFLPVLVAVTFELQRLFARYCTTGPLRALLVAGLSGAEDHDGRAGRRPARGRAREPASHALPRAARRGRRRRRTTCRSPATRLCWRRRGCARRRRPRGRPDAPDREAGAARPPLRRARGAALPPGRAQRSRPLVRSSTRSGAISSRSSARSRATATSSEEIRDDEEALGDPELRELALAELQDLHGERDRLEGSIQLLLLPAGSQRQEEHDPRDPQRRGRRGGGALRGRSLPHVRALRRDARAGRSRCSRRARARPAGSRSASRS